MSYNGSGKTTTPKYAEVSEYMVRPDQGYQFASFVRDLVKMCAENKSKVRFSTYGSASGTADNKYVIVFGYESLTEKDDNSENWGQWFNKMKGSQGAAWYKELADVQGSYEIYGTTNFLIMFEPDLSSK